MSDQLLQHAINASYDASMAHPADQAEADLRAAEAWQEVSVRDAAHANQAAQAASEAFYAACDIGDVRAIRLCGQAMAEAALDAGRYYHIRLR